MRNGDTAGGGRTRAGHLAAWGLGLLAVVSLATSLPTAWLLGRPGGLQPGLPEMAVLGLLTSLLPLVLIPGVRRERSWAWSAACALLGLRAVDGLAGLAWQLARLPALLTPGRGGMGSVIRAALLRELPATLARGAALTLVAALLFTLLFLARERFGVDRRRPWGTLVREGWWMLVVAGVPQALGVLWILASGWRL